MTGNSCLIYYVTASFVYTRSLTPFRSDAYEEKPRCLDLLHAFFAPNALFLNKIGHKTLKNHKKRNSMYVTGARANYELEPGAFNRTKTNVMAFILLT